MIPRELGFYYPVNPFGKRMVGFSLRVGSSGNRFVGNYDRMRRKIKTGLSNVINVCCEVVRSDCRAPFLEVNHPAFNNKTPHISS
jgi:hypothetical protein